jgi:hypothetical protein
MDTLWTKLLGQTARQCSQSILASVEGGNVGIGFDGRGSTGEDESGWVLRFGLETGLEEGQNCATEEEGASSGDVEAGEEFVFCQFEEGLPYEAS